MIVRTRGSDREVRVAPFADDFVPSPERYYGGAVAHSGEMVTVEKAVGLPAVLAAIRLIAETVASLPVRVFTGTGADKRPQEKSWEWKLLHDQPNDEQSAFDFWYDLAVSVETFGNAYIYKAKSSRRVEALYGIDPSIMHVERDRETGEKIFVVHRGQRREYTAAEILHVRGITLKAGEIHGLSPIAMVRHTLGAGLSRQEYEGRLYANDSTPPGAISVPGKIGNDAAETMVARWKNAHQGAWNAGNPAVLSNGATWETFGLPLKDAQFIESKRHDVDEVGRMFGIPAELLGGGSDVETEEAARRFLNFGLNSRLRRIVGDFHVDPDLFNAGPRYPEFDVEGFVRADATTQAQVRHWDVQSGVLLPDEARADLGRPPLPDGLGKIPQVTPVGGAPNVVQPGAPAGNSQQE